VEIKGANPRRCYGIPLRDLEDASLAILDTILAEWGAISQTAQMTEDRSALWRPSIPLVVLERCQNPYQINTWLALRWLQAAFPGRTAFSSRLLARRARVNQKYLYWTRPGKPSWIDQLIDAQLLTDVTDDVKRDDNARERPRNAQRHITIPLKELEQESLGMVIPILTAWGVQSPAPQPIPNQLMLAFAEGDLGLSRSVGGDAGARAASADTLPARTGTQPDPALPIAPTPYELAQRVPTPPPTIQGWPPLMATPAALWLDARATIGERDWDYLAELAAEHDRTTGGCGWFFVAQAIQAAMESGKEFRTKDNPLALKYIWGVLENIRERGYIPRPRKRKGTENGQAERNATRPGRTSAGAAADTAANRNRRTASRYTVSGGASTLADRDERS
jgi:hypothetical protein